MKSTILRRLTVLSFLFLFGFAGQAAAQQRDRLNAMTYFMFGVRFANEGNLQKAVYAFNQALQLDPGYADAWLYKGLTLATAGYRQEAVPCLVRALQLKPALANDANLAQLLQQLGLIPGGGRGYSNNGASRSPQPHYPGTAQGGFDLEACRKARRDYQQCMASARQMGSSLGVWTTATCQDLLDACR